MQYPTRVFKDYIVLFVKGMAMGAADVVPGVSGGTVAFITGIYDELLHSLSQLTPKVLGVWKREGLVSAWKFVNGNFLLTMFAGIALSVFTLAKLITAVLDKYPVLVWSFFFGLILASIWFFAKQQSGWRWREWLACAIGMVLLYGISVATPPQLPPHPLILFGGGFFAICAMILPGISGSFILLLVGLYPVVLRAVTNVDVFALAVFMAGSVAGLLAFSRFLSWLLDTYHKITLAVLIGFLVGSLGVIWPWKLTLKSMVDEYGHVIPVVQENVLPSTYTLSTGLDALVLASLGCMLAGIVLVLLTEIVSVYMSRGDASRSASASLKN